MTYGAAPEISTRRRPEINEKVGRLFANKLKVLCLWVAALLISIPFHKKFHNAVSNSIDPPKGTPSYVAEMKIRKDFHSTSVSNTHNEMVLISCTNCTSVLGEFSVNTTRKLITKLTNLNNTHPGIIKTWSLAVPALGALQFAGLIPATNNEDVSAGLLLSADNRTMAFQHQWHVKEDSSQTMDMIEELTQEVRKLNRQGQKLGFTALATGEMTILQQSTDAMGGGGSVSKEIFLMPFAILVLLYHVRSWRLGMLACISIFVSVMISEAALLPIALYLTKLSTLGPPILMSLGLALSVDYALFIMTRFKSELADGKEVEEALSIALTNSGCVVLLSGLILALCCFCCMLFPGTQVNSLALCALWSVSFSMLASLTFCPCMIVMFPSFFSSGLTRNNVQSQVISTPKGSRWWFMVGSWLTRFPFSLAVPLVITAFMLPCAWQLKHMKFATDLRDILMPRHSEAASAYSLLERSFPLGVISPVQVHLGGMDSVTSDAFFEESCGLFHRLVDSTRGTTTELKPKDINSIVTIPTQFSSMFPATCPPLVCLRWSRPAPECPIVPSAAELLAGVDNPLIARFSKIFRNAWEKQVSLNNKTMLASMTPAFSQSGPLGTSWKKVLKNLDTGNLDVSYYSIALMDSDSRDADYDRLPLVLGLTCVLMFVLMSIFFGAAFAPIKLFFTIIMPILFVYGFQVMVYQYGILSWIPWEPFMPLHGIMWMVPITSMTVLIGLAVDYEVFLFSRVVEFRLEGYDNRASVVGGLAATGPIITGAGIIMSVAFFGLMLEKIGMAYQMGCALTFGVLMDTFIVRVCLVPPILMLGDTWNYWPRKMPEPTRSMSDMENWITGAHGLSKKLMNP